MAWKAENAPAAPSAVWGEDCSLLAELTFGFSIHFCPDANRTSFHLEMEGTRGERETERCRECWSELPDFWLLRSDGK